MNRNAGVIIGISAIVGLALAAKAQSNRDSSGADTTDPGSGGNTNTGSGSGSKPKPQPKPTVTVWETWAKTYGGPVDWWKACYNAGIRKAEIAQILVVLRTKKDLGYEPGKLNWKYDDAGRATYLKWAVRKAKEIGLDFKTVPALYTKAFNQDVIKQYGNALWLANTFVVPPLQGIGSGIQLFSSIVSLF